MKRYTLITLTLACLLICILDFDTEVYSETNAKHRKIVKAGFFQKVADFFVDLFDGDGNVNGTPGDPYNITLGKNGKHGGSWAI